MSRAWRIFVIAGSVAVVANCAPITAGSHIEHDVDFRSFRTYDWGPTDALPLGDPRLERDPYFQDHFEGAIEKGLAAKGYERSNSRPPDLFIHYHASVSTRIDVNRIDREHGYCYDENCQARVTPFEASTLVLDVIDVRANRLIWRGWAQRDLEGMLGNRAETARVVDEAVARMLEQLPAAR